ncbi:hypothetical protein BJV82DRAFT_655989 [Fennellomyces sp. T-0311]|nr:hypothetical protein BJV82DRAFT_655989 [Fennellomyces sp. T-0311]
MLTCSTDVTKPSVVSKKHRRVGYTIWHPPDHGYLIMSEIYYSDHCEAANSTLKDAFAKALVNSNKTCRLTVSMVSSVKLRSQTRLKLSLMNLDKLSDFAFRESLLLTAHFYQEMGSKSKRFYLLPVNRLENLIHLVSCVRRHASIQCFLSGPLYDRVFAVPDVTGWLIIQARYYSLGAPKRVCHSHIWLYPRIFDSDPCLVLTMLKGDGAGRGIGYRFEFLGANSELR